MSRRHLQNVHVSLLFNREIGQVEKRPCEGQPARVAFVHGQFSQTTASPFLEEVI